MKREKNKKGNVKKVQNKKDFIHKMFFFLKNTRDQKKKKRKNRNKRRKTKKESHKKKREAFSKHKTKTKHGQTKCKKVPQQQRKQTKLF